MLQNTVGLVKEKTSNCRDNIVAQSKKNALRYLFLKITSAMKAKRNFQEVATVSFVNCNATEFYNGLTCRHVYDSHRTNHGYWENTLFERYWASQSVP